MGLRVKKILCYGLTDVKTNGSDIVDERFNPQALELLNSGVQDDQWRLELDAFLKQRCETSPVPQRTSSHLGMAKYRLTKTMQSGEWRPEDTLVYDFEYGVDGFVGFIPPSDYEMWRRVDDLIDYYQESGIPEAHIKRLDGIYPYIATFIDTRTQAVLSDRAIEVVRIQNGGDASYLPEVLTHLNMTLEEFQQFVRPAIPKELHLICEFLQLFSDPRTLSTCHPYLYTYWS